MTQPLNTAPTPADDLNNSGLKIPGSQEQSAKKSWFTGSGIFMTVVILVLVFGFVGVLFSQEGLKKQNNLLRQQLAEAENQQVPQARIEPVEQKVVVTTAPATMPSPTLVASTQPVAEPAYAPAGVFVGAGKESDHVRKFRLEELVVIVKDAGTQTVRAVVSDEHLPILVKPNQPAPPVEGLEPNEFLVPCPINIRPETPNIFKLIWVVSNKDVKENSKS